MKSEVNVFLEDFEGNFQMETSIWKIDLHILVNSVFCVCTATSRKMDQLTLHAFIDLILNEVNVKIKKNYCTQTKKLSLFIIPAIKQHYFFCKQVILV